MAGPADAIQRAVHALESGGLAVWVRRALIVVALVGLALFYQIREFRGLATSHAMDQAQIGRQLASGHGFRTQFIRPRAIGQLQARGKDVATNIWYDTYNAPLPPLLNAVVLFPFKARWQMTPADVIYAGDKVIAFTGILLFFASLVLLYFIARRLFDQRLALMACGIMVLCDLLWQYSISGLPQMLMLFLFHGTIYLVVRAVQAQDVGGRVGFWLAGVGAGFGLLALTHALTIWIFVAALLFFAIHFRPRGWAALLVLAVFLAIYSPWLLRNYVVSGHPGGVAIYSVLADMKYSEAGWMRRIGLDTTGVGPAALRTKIVSNVVGQAGQLVRHLGWNVVALAFFFSLMHRFKRPETAMLKWMLLALWLGAFAGMSLYGLPEEQGFAANQLHLLFLPLMTCFGLAFLLVQWNRTEVDLRVARVGFIVGLFLLCSLPLLFNMIMPRKAQIRWPPYVPPYIAVLNSWMGPAEITASDMPWAIAWYADRRALWVPENVRVMTELNDWGRLGGPINGLYLTPISGSQNVLTDILKGEYRNWATVILRSVDLQTFPLKWATLLGLENECVFFSNEDRQKLPAR